MGLFSEREGLTSRQQITDDAPQWLRNGFFNQVLGPFLHMDRSSNPYASATDSVRSPIGVKSLIERISIIARISPPTNYRVDMISSHALQEQLSVLPWFHFYNTVELVSELLRGHDNEVENRSYNIQHFQRFRENTNKLFKEGAVGWELNGSGKLQRRLPAEVSDLENSTVATNASNPISVHITKARGFINQHPCDAANAIKESVSAVESLALTVVPSAKTLGEAVNRLRNNPSYPALLLTVIEKLYAFACAEPAVRHGSSKEERVIWNDAEFVYVTSLAIIRYLEETRK